MKQPTYEEVMQAYINTAKMLEEARMEIQAIKSDKILEKLHTMMRIMENKENYPKQIQSLALWHMKQMMAKPKQ